MRSSFLRYVQPPPNPASHNLLSPTNQRTRSNHHHLNSQVESLTLRGGHQTTHRRVPALPQLKCTSHPSLCAKHTVDLMRCENKGAGYDTEDIQWSCHAQLPPELKLGSTDVICEGYAGPDDPYVLKGSCGVEYRLALTRAGEEKWPDLAGGGDEDGAGASAGGFAVLFWIIFVAVVGWIVYSAWTESRRNRGDGNDRGPRWGGGNNNNFWGGGGGGGGGGDDGWDDPPPPYPGTSNNAPRRNYKRSSSRQVNNNRQSGNGLRDGLLSGAAGAAAGYYFGSRGRNINNGGYEGGGSGGRNYGSTWGSGGAGSSRSGSASSGSAASSSRYESTGFGSTSRR